MMKESNVLILDEPTNHLDIETKENLEDALLSYNSAVLSVSHDRYYLNKICNRIMYLTGKDIKVYDGNYDYAMEKESIINTKIKEKTLEVKKEENKDNRNTSKLSNNKRTAYEKELKDIELLMDKLESEKEEIAIKMNDPDFFSNEEKVEKVSFRLNDIQNLLEEKELRWLEITEILENDKE